MGEGSIVTAMSSLRARNRHNAMRLTQRTALDLFAELGFDNVTVDRIAAEVGMAASTIYRHFTTKEAIVLWDEHEVDLDDALERELGRRPPLEAMATVFAQELGSRYDEDLDFQLRRVQYIYATEALHAASFEADYQDTVDLAEGLVHFLSEANRPAAPLLARAAMVALDTAFDRWQRSNGATPLEQLIVESFDTLGRLADLR